jgi:hypothetical protein
MLDCVMIFENSERTRYSSAFVASDGKFLPGKPRFLTQCNDLQ